MHKNYTPVAFIALVMLCVSAAYALTPQSGNVYWSGARDGGFADAGFLTLDGGWIDGGPFLDSGVFLEIDGGVCADGGLSCNSCGGSCNVDGGPQYTVPQDGGWDYIDGGWVDGGFQDGGFVNFFWLADADAIYSGGAVSNAVTFESGGPGGILVYLTYVPGAGSQMLGSMCIQEGIPNGSFANIAGSCATLDGGVGPFIWDIGGLNGKAWLMRYTPSAADDGGAVYATFNQTQAAGL